MNTLRRFGLYAWLFVASSLAVLASIVTRFGPPKFGSDATHALARWWGRGMLRITGSICRVEGLDTIEGSGPYVILSNHRSHMDAPVLVASLPFPFGFLVKKELMRIPIFAGAMKSIGCVEVNRDRDGSDHRVLDAVSEQIAQGRNILVFPEGTRSPNDDFLPFKNGGAVLAIKAGVPVLPVAVSGTNRVVPARILRVTPGPLLLRIGKAIPTSGLTMDDRYELMDDARRAIESMYVPDYRGDS